MEFNNFYCTKKISKVYSTKLSLPNDWLSDCNRTWTHNHLVCTNTHSGTRRWHDKNIKSNDCLMYQVNDYSSILIQSNYLLKSSLFRWIFFNRSPFGNVFYIFYPYPYITGQWGKFTVKNVLYNYIYFLGNFFCLFFIKNFAFLSFSFLFLMKYWISATEHYGDRW